MKRVLVVSYYYAQEEVIGSIRVQGLIRHLDQFGWIPTLLTVSPDQNVRRTSNIIYAPIKPADPLLPGLLNIDPDIPFKEQVSVSSNGRLTSFLECALQTYKEIVYYPDEQKGWYSHAIAEGSRELRQNHYDVILSSSTPYTSHIIARELKQRHGVPWIADFRDLWTQNHFFKHSVIRRLFETRLEKRTISSADAITTVSEPLADKLSTLHESVPVFTITNGFDPDLLNHGSPASNCFNIVYTGKIYNQKQDPVPLFIALRSLIDNRLVDPSTIRVDFYGSQSDWIYDEISRYNLGQNVFLHNTVTRELSLNLQRNAQILLLLAWNDPGEKGIYTGKIFEYLAAKRPILSIGSKGSVIDDLLLQTHAGISLTDPLEISNYLCDSYRDYLSSGCVQYHGKENEVQRYTHIEMAKKFATVLNGLVRDS